MGEVKFVDTTIRDGNQSLWGATGLSAGMILSIGRVMDRVGFKAIDLTASTHMGVAVRYHKENPWEIMRLAARRIRKTPLAFGTTGRRFIGFKRVPDAVMALVLQRVALNGLRRVWILDAAHDVAQIVKVAGLAKAAGIEEVVAVLCFTISPVHSDEYYAAKAAAIARCPDVDTLCLEDQGGLLTPSRVTGLISALRAACGGKTLEIHFHCNTGLAAVCYLEAVRLGVDVVHTTVPPLAYGTSLPSVFNIAGNLPHLSRGSRLGEEALRFVPAWLTGREGYHANLDHEALEAVAAHFQAVAVREGRPVGRPVEHDAYYYVHQVPGGMMTTLKRQLAEMKMENRFGEVLREVVRVRRELGYPVMATPFSQFVGTQAAMNVIHGERYQVIPTGVIEYAAGWFGPPPVPIDPDVMGRIAAQPKAGAIFASEFPQPSVAELRREMGLPPGVPDEEFLLRYVLIGREVDEMLAAGPVNPVYRDI